LSAYIFRTKACIDNRKKNLLNSYTSSTCPNNMVNVGLLTAEICWWIWSTPANFSWFRILAALPHGTLVVGVSQTLHRWTEGATYIWQGGHQVGHWPTFLVMTSKIALLPTKCHIFMVWWKHPDRCPQLLSCIIYGQPGTCNKPINEK